MATEKQINYAMSLLSKKGYSTKYMDASFRNLGATCKERQGSVIDWLVSMDKRRISKLIDNLK